MIAAHTSKLNCSLASLMSRSNESSIRSRRIRKFLLSILYKYVVTVLFVSACVQALTAPPNVPTRAGLNCALRHRATLSGTVTTIQARRKANNTPLGEFPRRHTRGGSVLRSRNDSSQLEFHAKSKMQGKKERATTDWLMLPFYKVVAERHRLSRKEQSSPSVQPNTVPRSSKEEKEVKMKMVSNVGLAASIGLVLTLAMSNEPTETTSHLSSLNEFVHKGGEFVVSASSNEQEMREITGVDSLVFVEEGVGKVGVVAKNIMSVALPQSATDVVATALGEGIAGVTGAVATSVVGSLLGKRMNNGARDTSTVPTESVQQNETFNAMETRIAPVSQDSLPQQTSNSVMVDGVITEAVADGDYFLTRAAALPLLEAVGAPPFAATLASVVLATVPYELVKIGSRRRRKREEEDRLMDALFQEQQKRKQKRIDVANWFKFGKNDRGKASERVLSSAVDSYALKAERSVTTSPTEDAGSSSTIDQVNFVELFSDITKWLEYDVLVTDLGGTLRWNGYKVASGFESAVFGFLAALSSQMYADTLYLFFDYGPEAKRQEVRTRSLGGWANVYTAKCLSAAALFGVYESLRLPVSQSILAFLAGGVDSCVGSQDFDMCMETFIIDNPPGASFEAQIRSFVTAMSSLAYRFEAELYGDVDLQGFTRSLFVQLYSIALRYLPSTIDGSSFV